MKPQKDDSVEKPEAKHLQFNTKYQNYIYEW